MGLFSTCVFVCAIIASVCGVEKEITVYVDAGKQDCFYQEVKQGQVIDIEYQVIDGGHAELIITFQLIDPTGRILNADFKKSSNYHRTTAQMDGAYRFCFDNTFSSFTSKTVFFELVVESENSEEEEEDTYEGMRPEEVYELTVQEIQEIIGRVKAHVTKVRHLQDIIKSTEARDRNLAEANYNYVNTYGLCQIAVMMTVGFMQVIMVRSLFDDKSKVHKIWKGLNSRH